MAFCREASYVAGTPLPGITTAIHALVRVLANNEALRELQAISEPDDLDGYPLDAVVTEGLFAASTSLASKPNC